MRESCAKVGKLALGQMAMRTKKWRMKREKEGGVRLARVGGPLELVYNERVECKCTPLYALANLVSRCAG